MNKLKIVPLILGVSLIFLLAGCTETGTTNTSTAGDALVIADLNIDPFDGVYGDEPFYVEVDLMNQGKNTAENIQPRIIGFPDSVTVQEEPAMIAEMEPSEFPETLIWVFVPMAMKTTISYPFEVVIDYDYTSYPEAIMRVANRDWIRSLSKEEQEVEKKALEDAIKSFGTDGPISTEFKQSSRNPYAENGEATVYLEFKNKGSGRPIDDEIVVTVNSGDLVCENTGSVKLINGETGHLKCTAFIGDVTEWKSIEASLELSYKYSIRKTGNEVKIFGENEMI